MSAQTNYGYFTVKGAAGGIYDLAPYAVDTFLNEATTGALDFGCAAIKGTKPGVTIKACDSNATYTDFEGIVTNKRTGEYDLEGELKIRHGAGVGVMRYGRIYGVLKDGVTVTYGGNVYVDANGHFSPTASDGFKIPARFMSTKENGLALIELFNESAKNT